MTGDQNSQQITTIDYAYSQYNNFSFHVNSELNYLPVQIPSGFYKTNANLGSALSLAFSPRSLLRLALLVITHDNYFNFRNADTYKRKK